MYNTPKPNLEDLPTSAQLLRSTGIAIASAAVILVTIVLPAEYNVDPTGIGEVIGLSEMGEIKTQLAEEAEADRQMTEEQTVGPRSSLAPALLDTIFGLAVGSAHAQEAPSAWIDEVTFSLEPGQGTEIKLAMEKGATAKYEWTVAGGAVNYDAHGDGGGESISYEKGRAVETDTGKLTAAFTGNHGWFWRNRGDAPVSVTLRVAEAYSEITRFD